MKAVKTNLDIIYVKIYSSHNSDAASMHGNQYYRRHLLIGIVELNQYHYAEETSY